jgi:hypothetical protein
MHAWVESNLGRGRRLSSALSFTVATTISVLALVPIGCLKEDPVVTGKRDASSDARVIGTVVPSADDADDDPPDCRRCADTLSTDTPRGTLCRKNGDPSSARRSSSFADCVCYDRCIQPCGGYCAGANRDDACNVCVLAQCGQALTACLADKRESQ